MFYWVKNISSKRDFWQLLDKDIKDPGSLIVKYDVDRALLGDVCYQNVYGSDSAASLIGTVVLDQDWIHLDGEVFFSVILVSYLVGSEE